MRRLAVLLLSFFIAACRHSSGSGDGGSRAAYTGSARCAECHRAEFDAWRGSQHAAAMQLATPATVLGDFSNTTFVEGSDSSRFFRRGERFVVNTLGADGKSHDFEVTHTFGVYPLQQYLVAFAGGRYQPLTLSWDTRPPEQGGQRWLALDAVMPLHADDDGHWTGRAMNWNFMCADCHATAVRKGYVAASDTFDTRFGEIGVGCEGCHGPGERHARWGRYPALLRRTLRRDPALVARLDERRGVSWRVDSTTGNAVRSRARTTSREIEACAQCHARREHIADGYEAGRALLDYYDPLPLLPSLYHPDGQQEDEVYDHASFLQSRMHAFGVTCADCHEPHSQKLRLPGNAVCGQCHVAARYDTTAHHGHARASAGSSCASCHMPVNTYLEIDERHDHSIRIPRPDRTATLGVPNACARCHGDRDAAWAVASIRSWGGKGNPGFQRFAEAFAADERGRAGAVDSLLRVARDASEPAVARASALARLGRYRDPRIVGAAMQGGRDADPFVRRWALEALEGVPAHARIPVAAPLLADPRRAVRQKAAWLLAPVFDSLPRPEWRRALDVAAREFMESQRYNADRAEARVTLGAFLLARRDTAAAIAEFEEGRRRWPRQLPALFNLVAIRARQGREAEGERLLRDAMRAMPEEAELHHELARALARQGRLEEALAEARAAQRLAPEEPRYARTAQVLTEARAPR